VSKFKVGDTVWYPVLESFIEPSISIDQHRVVEVYHTNNRSLYRLDNSCDMDNFEGNPVVNEADLYGTEQEARADAAKVVREQIEAWKKVLKGLEDA